MNAIIGNRYKCVWSADKERIVEVKELSIGSIWAAVIWMEKRATMGPELVDIQMNDWVPVNWLKEIC